MEEIKARINKFQENYQHEHHHKQHHHRSELSPDEGYTKSEINRRSPP